jgi:hypothetical protein
MTILVRRNREALYRNPGLKETPGRKCKGICERGFAKGEIQDIINPDRIKDIPID